MRLVNIRAPLWVSMHEHRSWKAHTLLWEWELTPPVGFPTPCQCWGGPTAHTSLPARCKERDQAGAGGHGVFRRSEDHALGKSPSCGNGPDTSLKVNPGLSSLREQGKVVMLGHTRSTCGVQPATLCSAGRSQPAHPNLLESWAPGALMKMKTIDLWLASFPFCLIMMSTQGPVGSFINWFCFSS